MNAGHKKVIRKDKCPTTKKGWADELTTTEIIQNGDRSCLIIDGKTRLYNINQLKISLDSEAPNIEILAIKKPID